MLGWLHRMLFRRPSPPDQERFDKAVRLEAAREEVQAQTVKVRRIRLEAAAAQRRVSHR